MGKSATDFVQRWVAVASRFDVAASGHMTGHPSVTFRWQLTALSR